jgi:hypothetical protein
MGDPVFSFGRHFLSWKSTCLIQKRYGPTKPFRGIRPDQTFRFLWMGSALFASRDDLKNWGWARACFPLTQKIAEAYNVFETVKFCSVKFQHHGRSSNAGFGFYCVGFSFFWALILVCPRQRSIVIGVDHELGIHHQRDDRSWADFLFDLCAAQAREVLRLPVGRNGTQTVDLREHSDSRLNGEDSRKL